jgi:hypothetical protein
MSAPLGPVGSGSRCGCCTTSSTTAYPTDESDWFTITHPFHPLRGKRYELLERRKTWNADRVFYFDCNGTQRSFATNLTDVLPPDAFVEASASRASFRLADLLELRERLDRHLAKSESAGNQPTVQ